MAHEIVINKRFSNKMLDVLDYLKEEWSEKIAFEFLDTVYARIDAIQINPFIGAPVGLGTVRSLHVTKHNRLFYRVESKTVIILNLYDTRSSRKRQ